ncbi:hypothetical protein [Streptomyces tsukubensis]|uniref:hypothetical protein n=2 Tax=Actinomycetes TaxID=1760 RepID=UPI00344C55F1
MIIIHTPPDGEEQQYDAEALRVSEISIAQRTTDRTWGALKASLYEDDPEAMRVVVWLLRKRTEPSLRYGDFDPVAKELVARMDRDEITAYVTASVEQVRREAPEVTGALLAVALREVPQMAADPEHARTLVDQLTAEDDEGKEPGTDAGPGPVAEDESPTPT